MLTICTIICQAYNSSMLNFFCFPGYDTCYALGDPHFKSFDNFHYDFQGTCKYNMVSSTSANTQTTPFQIYIKNEHRGSNQRVSYAFYFEIHVYGHIVRVNKNFLVSVSTQFNVQLHCIKQDLTDTVSYCRWMQHHSPMIMDTHLMMES